MKKLLGRFTLMFDAARRRRLGPQLLAGLITLLIIALYLDDHRALAMWELGIQDLMVSLGKRPSAPSNVVIVPIDDEAVKQLGPWPWDAERVGYLVGMLAEYKPRAIGLDFEISDDVASDSVGNRFLAEMVRRAGNVVLPLHFTLGDPKSLLPPVSAPILKSSIITYDQAVALMDSPYPKARRLSHPYDAACRAAWGLGQTNTWQDIDGKVRHDPLVVNYEGEYYPSMALQLARCALGMHRSQVQIDPGRGIVLGARRIPTDEAGRLLIDYRGPAGTIPSVSAAQVLEGKPLESRIAGKVVLVGVTASGYGTSLRTPVSSALPRTEKIATVASNILAGHYITTVTLSTVIDLLILVAIGAFCGFVLPRVVFLYRVMILCVMAFLFIDLNYVLYNSFQLITKTLYPSLQILLFLVFSPAMKLREAEVERPRAAKRDRAPGTMTRHGTGKTTSRSIGKAQATSAATAHAGDEDDVPVRVIRENEPVGAIGGLQQTVAIDTGTFGTGQPAVSQDSGAPDDTPRDTPETAISPSDIMDASPQPLGATMAGQTAAPAGPLSVDAAAPRMLGRYEVLGVLGQGAMGTVYKGRDPAIDRMVALKTIRATLADDPERAEELRERLVREAKAAGKLSHPNIVTIYDVGAEGELRYIAMEYLEGYTLEQVIKRKVKLNYRIAARILIQVCDALEYAHNAGIVHRDIKPANIMVLGNFEIKVTDFGIARFDSPQMMSMTQTGIAMGTPHYISPEQLSGAPVDRRCDIFSLGVVAYELLTSTRPFKGDSISTLIYAITQTTPPPPSSIDENIPSLFDMVVGKALARDPLERYQTAGQMSHALKAFVEELSTSSYRV